MSNSIIAAIPVSDTHLVVWFDNSTCKRYTEQDLGISGEGILRNAVVTDDGSSLSFGNDVAVLADDLYARGEGANYVESEKQRLLKTLCSIRHEAGFSQTRLGEAAGIRQSVISRIEGCEISPQINTLLKLLAPLGKTLAIVDLKEDE